MLVQRYRGCCLTCFSTKPGTILIAAMPAAEPTSPILAIEDDLCDLSDAVERFAEVCTELIHYWRETIGGIASEGGRAVIWGAGSKGVAFLTTLDLTDTVAGISRGTRRNRMRFCLSRVSSRSLMGVDCTARC